MLSHLRPTPGWPDCLARDVAPPLHGLMLRRRPQGSGHAEPKTAR